MPEEFNSNPEQLTEKKPAPKRTLKQIIEEGEREEARLLDEVDAQLGQFVDAPEVDKEILLDQSVRPFLENKLEVSAHLEDLIVEELRKMDSDEIEVVNSMLAEFPALTSEGKERFGEQFESSAKAAIHFIKHYPELYSAALSSLPKDLFDPTYDEFIRNAVPIEALASFNEVFTGYPELSKKGKERYLELLHKDPLDPFYLFSQNQAAFDELEAGRSAKVIRYMKRAMTDLDRVNLFQNFLLNSRESNKLQAELFEEWLFNMPTEDIEDAYAKVESFASLHPGLNEQGWQNFSKTVKSNGFEWSINKLESHSMFLQEFQSATKDKNLILAMSDVVQSYGLIIDFGDSMYYTELDESIQLLSPIYRAAPEYSGIEKLLKQWLGLNYHELLSLAPEDVEDFLNANNSVVMANSDLLNKHPLEEYRSLHIELAIRISSGTEAFFTPEELNRIDEVNSLYPNVQIPTTDHEVIQELIDIQTAALKRAFANDETKEWAAGYIWTNKSLSGPIRNPKQFKVLDRLSDDK